MPEGAKIERIEDLKPGDVLVLPSSEASKLPSGMACIPVDQDLILYENDRGHLVIPCLCAPDAGGMRVKLLGGAGLLQFFTLKSRSGGEVCPSEIVCSTQPKRKQIAPGEAITVGLTTISNPYPYPIWVSGFDRDGDGRPERVRFSSDLGEMQMVVSVGPVRASDSGFWGDNPPRIGQVAPPRMVSSDVDLEAYKAAIKSHRATFIDTQTETDWDATDGLGAEEKVFPAGTRFAFFRRIELALLPDGSLWANPAKGGAWTEVEFMARDVRPDLLLAEAPDPRIVTPSDFAPGDEFVVTALGAAQPPLKPFASSTVFTLDGVVGLSAKLACVSPRAESFWGVDGLVKAVRDGWLLYRPRTASTDPKPTVPDDVQVGPVDFLALNKEFSSK